MLSAFTGLILILLAIFLTLYGATRTDAIDNPGFFLLPMLALISGLILWGLGNIEAAIREHTKQMTDRDRGAA